ncbi:MAG TPA: GtrA family protein [Phenylobacterium sp.]
MGLAGLAADTSVFMALHMLDVDRPVARAVSLGLATCLTWAINRRITFARTGRPPAHELSRYGMVAVVAQGFNYLLFLWLSVVFASVYPPILIALCAAAASGISYSGQRLFTFAPRVAAPDGDAT